MVNSSHFFVAASKKWPGDRASLLEAAAWIGGEPWTRRPLPPDRAGVVLQPGGPVLRTPGGPPQRWHPNLTGMRLQAAAHDPLLRALALRPGDAILDGTLGYGYDALVLAHAGARVLALEVCGPIAWYTADGLWRHDPATARRIAIARADHRTWLAAAPDRAFDGVYLDPPFPADRAKSTVTFATLRSVAPPSTPSVALLTDALRVARRRVVLKLPIGEPVPAAPPGAELVGSRHVRFAVWGR